MEGITLPPSAMNYLTSLVSDFLSLSPFSSSPTSSFFQQPSHPREYYNLHDILAIRSFFLDHLPLELVSIILDYGEIWVREKAERKQRLMVFANPSVESDAGLYYIVGPEVPSRVRLEGEEEEVKVKLRRVRFGITSHDQGWSEINALKGTYQASYTFFEACIFKPGTYELPSNILSISDINYTAFHAPPSYEVPNTPFHSPSSSQPSPPDSESHSPSKANPNRRHDGQRWHIQSNVHASFDKRTHTVTWDWDDSYDADRLADLAEAGTGAGEGFLQALEGVEDERDVGEDGEMEGEGKKVGILTRVMFPGWQNYVHEASVEVYWTI